MRAVRVTRLLTGWACVVMGVVVLIAADRSPAAMADAEPPPPARFLESGRLLFLFRPRVGVERVQRLEDVQRLHLLLVPAGRRRIRRLVLGRKRLPDPAVRAKYQAGDGLCLPHIDQALQADDDGARALAEALHGSDERLVRLDLGEFREAHTVARLTGAPPGYIGHDRPGELTEAIRRTPSCVVLLDGIEKALA